MFVCLAALALPLLVKHLQVHPELGEADAVYLAGGPTELHGKAERRIVYELGEAESSTATTLAAGESKGTCMISAMSFVVNSMPP